MDAAAPDGAPPRRFSDQKLTGIIFVTFSGTPRPENCLPVAAVRRGGGIGGRRLLSTQESCIDEYSVIVPQ